MAVVFALLAALANAIVVVTQHLASTAAPPKVSGLRLVLYLLKSPLWLLGWIALIGAFVFQALALHAGQLSVVQPLLVSELVFALILRQVWLHQSVATAAWLSALLTCAALSAFILVAEPEGGAAVPSSPAWVGVVIACGGVAGVMAVLARTGSPRRRAACYGIAAATVWALEATFIKAATDTLTQFGIGGAFEHWPIYAMAVGGLAGVVLEQAALHVGPLSVSQPMLVIVDPIVSILLGVWLFGERFSGDALAITAAVVCFAVLCAAVLLLTRTAPATMEPSSAAEHP